MHKISVIIPTYNPNIGRLNQVLKALSNQTLPLSNWELIIIDNNSNIPFSEKLALSWHPNVKLIKEPKLGLTYARLKGFQVSESELLVLVDDDNILAENYLSETLEIFKQNTTIAAVGGKSIPLFESTPPLWIKKFYSCLALRDLGEKIIKAKWDQKYPKAAPIGAGMAIRKIALINYIKKIQSGKNIITDRIGKNLSSGGDNDIVLEIIKAGWEVAYYPSLCLQHLIPKERIEPAYLSRMNKDSYKSWVHLLNNHGINPWAKISKPTLPLRKIKAWFVCQSWKSEENYIQYKGICGMYEALSEL